MDILKLGIDNGNAYTKCVVGDKMKEFCFKSGYVRTHIEPVLTDNLLKLGKEFYSIGSKRFNVEVDKTHSNKTLILTLACIAEAMRFDELDVCEVILAVGLPISNFGFLKKSFQEYFGSEKWHEFEWKGELKRIKIRQCEVFPQGYSAFVGIMSLYRNMTPLVIDIGGYTVDYFNVNSAGILDVNSARSMNMGVLTLFSRIQHELNAKDIRITEDQIEQIISNGRFRIFEDSIISLVLVRAKEFADELMLSIREQGYDTLINPIAFIGGGSLLLKSQIIQTEKVHYVEFFDIYANARGYLMLLNSIIGKD